MRKSSSDMSYQDRAKEFEIGQQVRYFTGATDEGRVVEVFPAIGMVTVQWPMTMAQHPVEELQIINPGEATFVAPKHVQIPGGFKKAPVSDGSREDRRRVPAVPLVEPVKVDPTSIDKSAKLADTAARLWVKKALYWNGKNRQYRCTKTELESGKFICPKKCCQGLLKKAIYKREDGVSVKLFVCPECLFMIRQRDLIVGNGEDC